MWLFVVLLGDGFDWLGEVFVLLVRSLDFVILLDEVSFWM